MKFKRSSLISKIVVVALSLYAVFMLWDIQSQINIAETEKERLQTLVEQKTAQNAALTYEIEHADDSKTKENIARNKLGLVLPGEKVFYDIAN